jgi:hypothetical protein
MEIVAKATGNIRYIGAGGLIGSLYNDSTASKIVNSAAINPKVLAIASKNAHSNRVIGLKGNDFRGNLSNNYALSSMLIGTSEEGAAYNSNYAGLTTVNGKSEGLGFFKNANNLEEYFEIRHKKMGFFQYQ